MGDRKDKNMEKNAEVGLQLTPDGGLGRSRGVRKLPPLPPSPSSKGEGEGSTTRERKRKRGRRKEAEDPTEEEVTHDGDDVKVMKGVKVRSPTDIVVSGLGMEGGEEATGQRSPSLCHQQPLLVGKGRAHQSEKVTGAVVQPGDASSSSVIVSSRADRRSEDGSLEQPVMEEEEAHPCLFIENILEVIFNYVIDRPGTQTDISKDIQTIRLVCKTWKDSAKRIYRRNGTITFDSYDTVSPNPSGQKSFTQFMETMKCSGMIPVQKFIFWGDVFPRGDLKLLEDFFRIHGPEFKSLIVQYTSSDELERLVLNLKNIRDLSMPKLKTLKLYTYGHYEPGHVESSGIVKLTERILTAASSLYELDLFPASPVCTCACCSRSSPDWIASLTVMQQQLGQVIAAGIPKTVKQLKLFMKMDEPTFNNLAEVGLKLESFEFGIGFRSVLGRRTLHNFLQSQAATLKDFKLWWRSSQKGILEFPTLDELVNLDLGDVIISVAAQSDFAKTFPKLHLLRLENVGTWENLHALLSSVKTTAQSLKVLHLPIWRYSSLAPFIKDVARSFPCVVDLHISLHHGSKGTLLGIFKYFDKLESLRIRIREQLGEVESLFCGISENDRCVMRMSQDFGDVNWREIQRQPSLLNLTKLRKLHLENDTCSKGWITFTDVSAHFVFLEMPDLREIHLPNSAIRFSPRYKDLLGERLVAGNY